MGACAEMRTMLRATYRSGCVYQAKAAADAAKTSPKDSAIRQGRRAADNKPGRFGVVDNMAGGSAAATSARRCATVKARWVASSMGAAIDGVTSFGCVSEVAMIP